MRKGLLFAVLLGVALVLPGSAFAKEKKIGYVDVFQVFNEYKKTQEYEKALDAKKTREETRLKQKEDELQKMQDRIALLKDAEKEKETAQLQDQADAYKKMAREVVTNLQKEREDKMKELVADVDKIIKDYAEKNGFDVVLNKTAVLFATPDMDVTKDILKIANSKYTGGAK